MSRPVIGFAGITHLGLNSAVAAAERGFDVVGFDERAAVISSLARGDLPVVEPDLPELFSENSTRLSWTNHVLDLARCEVVYIATDVPTDDQGQSKLSGIRSLIDTVRAAISKDAILVVLCQVPPGFTRGLSFAQSRLFYQVESLIYGRAVERAVYPERIMVGCADPNAVLPKPLAEFLGAFECQILSMGYESAELAKLSINCFLAASVTVTNTLAELSERIGADWSEIAPALRLDKRIGEYAYLSPGLGFGGGNLERDLATVSRLAEEIGSDAGLIEAFVANSGHCRDWVLRTLHDEVLAGSPKAVLGVLGLAYKENTNSTKNSPSLALINHLGDWRLRVYDPVVPASVANHKDAIGCNTSMEAARGADALVVMTPWPEFKGLNVADLAKVMAGRTVIDPGRVFDDHACVAAGLDYFTLGAPAHRAPVRAAHA